MEITVQYFLGFVDKPSPILGLASAKYNNWAEFKPLINRGLGRYSINIDEGAEYKFVLLDKVSGFWHWELGSNRIAYGDTNVTPPQFDVKAYRGSGVAVPVFSLRTHNSFGVGEFLDLKLLVDLAYKVGWSIIQILPINDTTMQGDKTDSYPYNANSAFALHPQYINLQAIGLIEDSTILSIKQELNNLKTVDYKRVNEVKLSLLHSLYKAKQFDKKAMECFANDNMSWLLPYAVYSVLRDKYASVNFNCWEELSVYNYDKAQAYYLTHKTEVEFYFYVQYVAHTQLMEVVQYAKNKGVVLKGDLPIGVSPCSCDVWQYPNLFNLNSQAGAPPDAFAKDGQNWGFPTYNWEEIKKEDYKWWGSRLGQMSKYFGAYRIDHVLGFFRIWEIPKPFKSGLMGYFNPSIGYTRKDLEGFYPRKSSSTDVLFVSNPNKKDVFYPRIEAYKTKKYSNLPEELKCKFNALYEDYFYHRNENLWSTGATEKLSKMQTMALSMLTCSEDLGMVPSCVPQVLSKLGILSLEVERMPKIYGQEFGNVATYPYLSVCTTSTHDTSTLRQWWEEDKERTQRYYANVLNLQGTAPKHLTAQLSKIIIEKHMQSPSMLCILPIQDYLSMYQNFIYSGNLQDERINDPSNPKQIWCYRLHIFLEDLLVDNNFATTLNDIIKKADRC